MPTSSASKGLRHMLALLARTHVSHWNAGLVSNDAILLHRSRDGVHDGAESIAAAARFQLAQSQGALVVRQPQPQPQQFFGRSNFSKTMNVFLNHEYTAACRPISLSCAQYA